MKAIGDQKRCSRCARWLHVSEYGKGSSYPDGLQNWCQECHRKYRASNAKKRAEYQRNYRRNNGETVRQYQRRYREEHPEVNERSKERSRRWYGSNKRRALENSLRWHLDNPDKVAQIQRDYYYRNQATRQGYAQRWRGENPEKVARQNEERRAREAGASIKENIDYRRIYIRDRDNCYLCGRKVRKTERHLDHVIPLCRGGAHSEDNLRVTHARCNLIKGKKLVEELDKSLFKPVNVCSRSRGS